MAKRGGTQSVSGRVIAVCLGNGQGDRMKQIKFGKMRSVFAAAKARIDWIIAIPTD